MIDSSEIETWIKFIKALNPCACFARMYRRHSFVSPCQSRLRHATRDWCHSIHPTNHKLHSSDATRSHEKKDFLRWHISHLLSDSGWSSSLTQMFYAKIYFIQSSSLRHRSTRGQRFKKTTHFSEIAISMTPSQKRSFYWIRTMPISCQQSISCSTVRSKHPQWNQPSFHDEKTNLVPLHLPSECDCATSTSPYRPECGSPGCNADADAWRMEP